MKLEAVVGRTQDAGLRGDGSDRVGIGKFISMDPPTYIFHISSKYNLGFHMEHFQLSRKVREGTCEVGYGLCLSLS
jgi:hypothetical protein